METAAHSLLLAPWLGASLPQKMAFFVQGCALLFALAMRFGATSTRGRRLFELLLVVPVLWALLDAAYRAILFAETFFTHSMPADWRLLVMEGPMIMVWALTLYGITSLIAGRPVWRGVPVFGLVVAQATLALDMTLLLMTQLSSTQLWIKILSDELASK